MTDAVSIALSGLTAQKQRLAVSASNIANVSTAGSVPSADPSAPASTVYRPLQANLTSVNIQGEGAGVKAEISEKQNPYSVIYDPTNFYANNEGLIAVPNVDLAEEIVKTMETKNAFKATLSVIKTEDEMMGDLLDILA